VSTFDQSFALLEYPMALLNPRANKENVLFSKAEFLATQKTIKWSSAENSDLKVTVFGDAAIATGNEKLKGTDASSKPLDLNERWTDTWVKMASGKWQCIATHQSPIKM
jgi:ketosteroid isomerase-like protein